MISPVRPPAGTGLEWDVLRLDTLHPVVSGNKIYKLRPWLDLAAQRGTASLLTFGGPWSNHIVATAFVARERGLSALGFIRGESSSPPTAMLEEAAGYGMELRFLGRSAFRAARAEGFRSFQAAFPGHLVIPEGGAGEPGVKGAESILDGLDKGRYTHIACACGTGTMMAGLVRATVPGQLVMGFDVVGQGDALERTLHEHVGQVRGGDWQVMKGHDRGGYARHDADLLRFMNVFHAEQGVPSDIVYTGKLFMALTTLAGEGFFPAGSRLLAIHSGGLQGNRSLAPGSISF